MTGGGGGRGRVMGFFFLFFAGTGFGIFLVAWEVAERRGEETGSGFEFFCYFFFNWVNIIIFLMYKKITMWQPHQHKCGSHVSI